MFKIKDGVDLETLKGYGFVWEKHGPGKAGPLVGRYSRGVVEIFPSAANDLGHSYTDINKYCEEESTMCDRVILVNGFSSGDDFDPSNFRDLTNAGLVEEVKDGDSMPSQNNKGRF